MQQPSGQICGRIVRRSAVHAIRSDGAQCCRCEAEELLVSWARKKIVENREEVARAERGDEG